MIEKVNPSHPDKVADRIAGALVDLAYKDQDDPKIAVEVLIGHGSCHIIAETSASLSHDDVCSVVERIAGKLWVNFKIVPQDTHLAENQSVGIRCGDNGIFKGVPVSDEEYCLSGLVRDLYERYPTDGKFILNWREDAPDEVIACQSNVKTEVLYGELCEKLPYATVIVNPLGDWTGGTDVDTGATNRKLGSDMGRAVTGGGLHGKDLSKADVAVNIVCHLLAQERDREIQACCAIGDMAVQFRYRDDDDNEIIEAVEYADIVERARSYVTALGGFEKLAEWGLF